MSRILVFLLNTSNNEIVEKINTVVQGGPIKVLGRLVMDTSNFNFTLIVILVLNLPLLSLMISWSTELKLSFMFFKHH